MTADDTTPARVAAAAEAIRDGLDEWLFRMHGITSSCDHRVEADAIAAAVVAALDAQPGDAERAGSGWRCDGCDAETTGKCAAIANPEDCSARAAGPDDDTAERALARACEPMYGSCALLPGHVGPHHGYPENVAAIVAAALDEAAGDVNCRDDSQLLSERADLLRAAADTGHQGGEMPS